MIYLAQRQVVEDVENRLNTEKRFESEFIHHNRNRDRDPIYLPENAPIVPLRGLDTVVIDDVQPFSSSLSSNPLATNNIDINIDYSNQIPPSETDVELVKRSLQFGVLPHPALVRQDSAVQYGDEKHDGPDRNDPYCSWREGRMMCA